MNQGMHTAIAIFLIIITFQLFIKKYFINEQDVADMEERIKKLF